MYKLFSVLVGLILVGQAVFAQLSPQSVDTDGNLFLTETAAASQFLRATNTFLGRVGAQSITNLTGGRITFNPSGSIGPYSLGPSIQLGSAYLVLSTNRAGSFAVVDGIDAFDVWDARNDGSGSGLDADLLDGLNSTYFLNGANITNPGSLASTLSPYLLSTSGGTVNGTIVSTNGYGMVFHSSVAGISKRLAILPGGSGQPWMISGQETGLTLADGNPIIRLSVADGVTIQGGYDLTMSDLFGTKTLRLSATGGLQVGTSSFRADVAGNISQDAANTAALGALTAASLTVPGFLYTQEETVGWDNIANIEVVDNAWWVGTDTRAIVVPVQPYQVADYEIEIGLGEPTPASSGGVSFTWYNAGGYDFVRGTLYGTNNPGIYTFTTNYFVSDTSGQLGLSGGGQSGFRLNVTSLVLRINGQPVYTADTSQLPPRGGPKGIYIADTPIYTSPGQQFSGSLSALAPKGYVNNRAPDNLLFWADDVMRTRSDYTDRTPDLAQQLITLGLVDTNQLAEAFAGHGFLSTTGGVVTGPTFFDITNGLTFAVGNRETSLWGGFVYDNSIDQTIGLWLPYATGSGILRNYAGSLQWDGQQVMHDGIQELETPFTAYFRNASNLTNFPSSLATTDQLPSSESVSNWNAAYSWGNHAAAGYLPSSGGAVGFLTSTGRVEGGTLGIGTNTLAVSGGLTLNGGIIGGGNPFDQDLNTTNDVVFNSVVVSNGVSAQLGRDLYFKTGQIGGGLTTNLHISTNGSVSVGALSDGGYKFFVDGTLGVTRSVTATVSGHGFGSGVNTRWVPELTGLGSPGNRVAELKSDGDLLLNIDSDNNQTNVAPVLRIGSGGASTNSTAIAVFSTNAATFSVPIVGSAASLANFPAYLATTDQVAAVEALIPDITGLATTDQVAAVESQLPITGISATSGSVRTVDGVFPVEYSVQLTFAAPFQELAALEVVERTTSNFTYQIRTSGGIAVGAADVFWSVQALPPPEPYAGPLLWSDNGDGTATITGYAGDLSTVEEITVPDTIIVPPVGASSVARASSTVTLSVIAVAESAFYGATNLQSISIATSLNSIGALAVANSPNVKSINFIGSYENISDIESGAFLGVENISLGLTNLILPNGLKSIGPEAFRWRGGLKSLVLPTTLTNIGEYAFYGADLDNIVIPEGVKSIRAGTFGYMRPTNVILPNSLTNIENFAFMAGGNPKRLHNIVIPANVRHIAQNAFANQPLSNIVFMGDVVTWPSVYLSTNTTIYRYASGQGWENVFVPFLGMSTTRVVCIDCPPYTGHLLHYTNDFTNVFLTGYAGDIQQITELEIPERINNAKVAGIESNAFANAVQLESVTLPEPVSYIKANAFDGAVSLSNLVMGGYITYIGQRAFYNSKNLKFLQLSSSIQSVGEEAFYNSGVTNLILTQYHLTNISDGAFASCTNLLNIIIDSPISIGANAFAGAVSLTNITFVDLHNRGGLILGNNLFAGATNLASAIFSGLPPSGVGTNVFGSVSDDFFVYYYEAYQDSWQSNLGEYQTKCIDCPVYTPEYTDVTKLYLQNDPYPNGTNLLVLGWLGEDPLYMLNIPPTINGSNVVGVGNFQINTIREVILPDTVTFIDGETFMMVGQLTNVVFGTNLLHIGGSAFLQCSALGNVSLPDSLLTLGNYNFAATAATSATIPDKVKNIEYGVYGYCANLTNVVIGSGVTNIEFNAFRNCQNLSVATFKGNAPTLGADVFKDVASGFKIRYYDGTTGWTDPFNGIATECIDCPEPYTGPLLWQDNGDGTATVTGWDTEVEAFSGSIIIPDHIQGLAVTDVGNSAFEWMVPNVITLGTNLVRIGNSAFAGDKGITQLNLPTSLRNIGASAFEGAGSLTNLVIPHGVTNLGANAFAYNYNVKSLHLPATLVSVGPNAFEQWELLESLTFAEGTTRVLENSTPVSWEGYTVNLPASVRELGTNVFRQYKASAGFNLDISNVTNIGPYAFYESSITNITLGTNLTQMGTYAFAVSALRSIELPDSLLNIPTRAFEACSDLYEITLPANLTNIGSGAFGDVGANNRVPTLTIPGTVKSIGGLPYVSTLVLGEGILNIASGFSPNAEYIVMASTITNIGDNAFIAFNGEIVAWPSNLVSIGSNAFRGAYIPSLTLPNSVARIGANAFREASCSSFTISTNLVYVGPYAFYELSGLNNMTLTLPGGLTSVEDGAFNSQGVTAVTLGNTVTNIGANTFGHIYYGHTIIPDSVVMLGPGAFSSELLGAVTIGAGLKNIPANAFRGTEDGSVLSLGSNVTNIGDNAFYAYKPYGHFVIPDSIVTIGNNVFSDNCGYALESLTIGSSVTSIGDNFFNCGNNWGSLVIPYVTFRGNAPTIGSNVFSGHADPGNFKIRYYDGTTGWTDPWHGFTTECVDCD